MTTVLLVDDSRVTREVMKISLVAAGMQTLDAANGAEALEVIRAHRPNVVVADLQMPKLDGVGLCLAVRQDAMLAEIPIVIVTSSADTSARSRCLSAGAHAVLTKPLNPKDLLDVFQRLQVA